MKRISKNIRSFFWVSLVIIACSCSNQLQSKSPVLIVPVYISNPNNDSLKGIVQTFFKELRKSISIESKINLVSGYNGKGILLLTRAQALRQGIEVPTAMAKMGEEALYVQANKQRVHIIGNSMLAL